MAENTINLGSVAVEHLIITDVAGSLVTGLLDGDFTKSLLDPSGSEVSGSITVTVTETSVGGKYKVTFTPNALGRWSLSIFQATHAPDGYHADWDVITASSGTADSALVSGTGTVTAIDSENPRDRFIDTALTASEPNFWKDHLFKFTTGPNSNQTRRAISFDETTKELVFVDPYSNDIVPGHEYVILSIPINDVTGADRDLSPVGGV